MARQYSEAERAFDIALNLDPDSPLKEADAGQAYAAAGDFDSATSHLERALQMDPLDLTATTLLTQIYNRQGKVAAAAQLSDRIRRAMSKP